MDVTILIPKLDCTKFIKICNSSYWITLIQRIFYPKKLCSHVSLTKTFNGLLPKWPTQDSS